MFKLCKKAFTQLTQLKKHILCVHNTEKPYYGEISEGYYKVKTDYEEHVAKKHHDKIPEDLKTEIVEGSSGSLESMNDIQLVDINTMEHPLMVTPLEKMRTLEDLKFLDKEPWEYNTSVMLNSHTVHGTFIHDEEINCHDGMQKCVHTEDSKSLNVGLRLVEDTVSPYGEIPAYVREGTKHNVIPEKFDTNVEINIIPTNEIAKFEAGLSSWMIEAVEWKMVIKAKQGGGEESAQVCKSLRKSMLENSDKMPTITPSQQMNSQQSNKACQGIWGKMKNLCESAHVGNGELTE